MNIRNKILLYFSTTIILLIAIAFMLVYILFSEYREEEFQQQQHNKIHATIRLIEKFKKQSAELSYFMDAQDIHDFYDEKLMVYDNEKDLVFSSLDDLAIAKRQKILNELSPSRQWVETKEDDYDLIGVYIENDGKSYYAICKAYDAFGYDKLRYLKHVLLGIFITISVVVGLISVYLSNIISRPINRLAELVDQYDLTKEKNDPIQNATTTHELQYLTARFNELLTSTQEVFTFQKHITNHISHQLKTPVAVLVSELEKIRDKEGDLKTIKTEIGVQVVRAKSLGNIINALLEISKLESAKAVAKETFRVDELLFDIMEELRAVYPHAQFDIKYTPEVFEEKNLLLQGNSLLMKQGFYNLLENCIVYSDNSTTRLIIDGTRQNRIKLSFINSGPAITEEEQKLLFRHFFRGDNSQGKPGFGLGLVLTQKIIHLHKGRIWYEYTMGEENVFTVEMG